MVCRVLKIAPRKVGEHYLALQVGDTKMEDLKWDKDRLYQLVQEKLGDYLFLVVSNRKPYNHVSYF